MNTRHHSTGWMKKLMPAMLFLICLMLCLSIPVFPSRAQEEAGGMARLSAKAISRTKLYLRFPLFRTPDDAVEDRMIISRGDMIGALAGWPDEVPPPVPQEDAALGEAMREGLRIALAEGQETTISKNGFTVTNAFNEAGDLIRLLPQGYSGDCPGVNIIVSWGEEGDEDYLRFDFRNVGRIFADGYHRVAVGDEGCSDVDSFGFDYLEGGSWVFLTTVRDQAGNAVANPVTRLEIADNDEDPLLTYTDNGDGIFRISQRRPPEGGEEFVTATFSSVRDEEGEEEPAVLGWKSIRITVRGSGQTDPGTQQAAMPQADPPAGAYMDPVEVVLSSATEGAAICYTLDGTDPTPDSTRYSAPVRIGNSLTLKAKAVAEGKLESDILVAEYRIENGDPEKVARPYAMPEGGTYRDKKLAVTLATDTAGAAIYYTTDGTEPGVTKRPYNGKPIDLREGTTVLRAIAVMDGMEQSDTMTETYIVIGNGKPAAPTADPPGGTYTGSVKVTLSTTAMAADICYTTDGTRPDSNGIKYENPIEITETTTLRARAIRDDGTEGAEMLEVYTIAEPVAVSGITLPRESISLMPGESCLVAAVITPENATDKTIVWTIADPEVAEVSADGTLRALQAGRTTLTASIGDLSAAAEVIVADDQQKAEIIDGADEETIEQIEEDLAGSLSVSALISTDEKDRDAAVIIDAASGVIKETRLWIGGVDAAYPWTGEAITPDIHVYDGVVRLVKGTDYTVSFKNNKNVGKNASATIKFRGSYKNDPQTVSFAITPAVIGEDILVAAPALPDTGRKQNVKLTCILKRTGKTLAAGKFAVSPAKIGESGFVEVSAKDGNISGSARIYVDFAESGQLLSGAKVVLSPSSSVYTGKAITPESCMVKIGKNTLDEGTDYVVKEVCNNIAPGTATVILEGRGNYRGSKTATFKILKGMDLTNSEAVKILVDGREKPEIPYVKGGVTPEVTVYLDDLKLLAGTDYTVSYSGNKAAGASASAMVRFKGLYKGQRTAPFSVTKQKLSALTILAEDRIASNKAGFYRNPTLSITDLNGKALTRSDYAVGTDYRYDETAGTVSVSITGKGDYASDPVEISYRVIDRTKNIKSAKVLTLASKEYTGREVMPGEADFAGKVSLSGTPLRYGTDFEVVPGSGKNNLKAGTASVVIRGINDYGGSRTVKFKIVKKDIVWKDSAGG